MDKSGNRLEKFAALCYPGMLPGLAMGFNCNGVVFTINTLVPKLTLDNGTRKKFTVLKILSATESSITKIESQVRL